MQAISDHLERRSRVNEEQEMDPKLLKVMHLHQNEAIAGWMPKREDFVYEWDNEAEDVIAEMEITDEDCDKDKEVKQRVLEIYNSKLDERKKRKEFVVNRNLLDLKAQEQTDKKRPRDEKELRDKMRPFSRFHTPQDHEEMMKGVLEERTTRQVQSCSNRSIEEENGGRKSPPFAVAC